MNWRLKPIYLFFSILLIIGTIALYNLEPEVIKKNSHCYIYESGFKSIQNKCTDFKDNLIIFNHTDTTEMKYDHISYSNIDHRSTFRSNNSQRISFQFPNGVQSNDSILLQNDKGQTNYYGKINFVDFRAKSKQYRSHYTLLDNQHIYMYINKIDQFIELSFCDVLLLDPIENDTITISGKLVYDQEKIAAYPNYFEE